MSKIGGKRRRVEEIESKDSKKMKAGTDVPTAILKNVLSTSELSALRKEVDAILSTERVDLVKSECVVDIFEGIAIEDETIRTSREKYMKSRETPSILSKSEYAVIRNLLLLKLPNCLRDVLKLKESDDVFLFNEHYVVKPARSSMEFRWHRDGDLQLAMLRALKKTSKYYSFWCALDDMSSRNGTLVFPNNAEIRVDAGDVVVFDSETLHSSGQNITDKPRRVFYAQYSTEPIRIPPRGDVLSFAIPCDVSKR